ncbi:hypothetical protein C922_02669 [Plasmodium inui San Antonio 1]|uniref:Uncharacterized protein n=1 Tax=Plasmodium inui San Antonio 1 TaxID=1237626 RepID=W7A5Q8_9APIC|nr:hypothetical protein C922_02669 [Plasmodium inui San Antonio 1]EUD67085.1 hypothetical protein C922_02669 [Plasmodium inui San Antonio 1]
MWNIFANEDLSLHIEKRGEESSEKKIRKKKGLETATNKNGLTKSGSNGSSLSKHDSKIKELRKNFRKKYRIVRTQLLKIIKILKQFPEVDAEAEEEKKKSSKTEKGQAAKDNAERDKVRGDSVRGDNVDKGKGGKKKEHGERTTNTTTPDGSDNQTIMVQVELIKKLNRIIEKIDVEKLKEKKRIKTKQNNKGKNEEEGLKNKSAKQTFTPKPSVAPPKNDSHKNNINVVKNSPKKKFPSKSANNFQYFNPDDMGENAGGMILLQNEQNSFRNEYFKNSAMNVYSKKNNGGNVYHDTDDMVVTDSYMYCSTLNAGSIGKKSHWLGDNMNHAITNDNAGYGGSSGVYGGSNGVYGSSHGVYGGSNGVYGGSNGVYDGSNGVYDGSNGGYGYNNFGGNNYGYSPVNYSYDSGNYDYAGGSFNCNYGGHNYNGGNYGSSTYSSGHYDSGNYASGSYNYEANNNGPFRVKGNHFAGNSNQEKGAGNKIFFQKMASASYTKSFKGGVPPHYEPQNFPNVAEGYYTQNRNNKGNMNNKKKGFKFAKDEKIRGLLRTATNEDDLVKAIGFAKNAGLHFEAKLGSKKLNKLKLEGEDGVPSEV